MISLAGTFKGSLEEHYEKEQAKRPRDAQKM
jgi:hypothetical protein